jgi:hypothetical protein
MNRLTISQVTTCVDSATRATTELLAIDFDRLTQALNAVLAADCLPETLMSQWCDVCQRNVDANHAHDKMVQTSDHHHSPLGR